MQNEQQIRISINEFLSLIRNSKSKYGFQYHRLLGGLEMLLQVVGKINPGEPFQYRTINYTKKHFGL